MNFEQDGRLAKTIPAGDGCVLAGGAPSSGSERMLPDRRPARAVGAVALVSAIALHSGVLLVTMSSVPSVKLPKPPPEFRVAVMYLPPPRPPTQASPVPPEDVAAAVPADPVSLSAAAVPPQADLVRRTEPAEPVALPLPQIVPLAQSDPPPAAAVPPPADLVRRRVPAKPTPTRSTSRGELPRALPPTRPAAAVQNAPPMFTQAAPPAAPPVAADPGLEARIRDAVQAAVHYPPAARMMGLTGRARILLDYRDGQVDHPTLAQSSGTASLDSAALAAAREAHYPKPPPALEQQSMYLLVWVEFRLG